MKQLSPTDPVPALRGDVVFSQRPNGAGAEVIHIRPVGSTDSARLHGFELSLARLLDGRRTAQDVVQRASRLGLPLSVPALQGFISQLEQHHLLARTAGEAASPISPWSQRLEWDPLVREQYQAALKALRIGHTEEARNRLDRLLATAPLLEEARSLRDWLTRHPSGSLEGQSFREVFARAEREWLKSTPRVVPLPGPTAAEALDRSELRAVRPSATPYVVMFLVLGLALLGLFIPFPLRVSAPAELTPITVTPLVAPLGGTIQSVDVEEGQWVTAGTPLVTYSDGDVVSAPSEGLVSDVNVLAGRPVHEGQQLLELQDTRQLRLSAQLNPRQAEQVQQGQRATIALGNQRAETTINAVSGRQVVTTFDNAGNAMEPGDAVVDIDVGSRSIFQRILP